MDKIKEITGVLLKITLAELQGISLPRLLLASMIVILTAFIIIKCLMTFGHRGRPGIVIYPFLAYLVFIAYITYFRRLPESRLGMNLEIFADYSYAAAIYLALNALLFVPYGFLLEWLVKRPPWLRFLLVTCCGFLTSLFIEIMQLQSGRGYFELNDLVTNTIGCGLGAMGAQLLISITKESKKAHEE